MGRSSLRATAIGVVSISIGVGVARTTNGLRVLKRTGGNSISPARCNMSNKPRQTIARNAPLACLHCHTSQSFSESRRRLTPGFSAINWRIRATSSAVTTRPRYLHSEAICRQCARVENGTQVFFGVFETSLFRDSRAAMPVERPRQDCRPPAAVAPDALAAFAPLRCLWATIGNAPWISVLSPARTPDHRIAKLEWPYYAECGR